MSRVYPEARSEVRPEAGTVRSLLGRSQVAMALACLGSLLCRSAEPVRLVLHDDGTLDEEARARLLDGLDGSVIVTREEADDRLAPLLARTPAIRAYRETNPLGLKLVDVVLLGASETLAYCDADVLFLQPFSGLFEALPAGVDALFMADSDNAYSVRSWDFLSTPGLRLRSRINSGIVRFRRPLYDLERVEWFLARPRLARRTPVWSEQTCWAVLSAAVATHLTDPLQVRFPPACPADAAGAVALHFISPLRDRLPAYLADQADRDGGSAAGAPAAEPVRVTTLSAPRCGPVGLFRSELRRRLG